MTLSDQKYYAAEKKRNERKKAARELIENRRRSAKDWKTQHQEGITQENLAEYQEFMKQADEIMR